MTRQITIINQSTLVSDQDAQTMVAAINQQLNSHFLPVWGMLSIPVTYAGKVTAAPGWTIALMDTLDDAEALGYHSEDQDGRIYGVVGAKASLDAGKKVLTGDYSVASILSHEVLELAADVHCAGWADSNQGYLVALEVCDPVQSDWYTLAGCSVSNFVTPDWFDPYAPRGTKFDYLGKLHRPFSMDKGGYWVQMREGRSTQKFGEQVPDWLRAVKTHQFARFGHLANFEPR
jgi:hypothetical protein